MWARLEQDSVPMTRPQIVERNYGWMNRNNTSVNFVFIDLRNVTPQIIRYRADIREVGSLILIVYCIESLISNSQSLSDNIFERYSREVFVTLRRTNMTNDFKIYQFSLFLSEVYILPWYTLYSSLIYSSTKVMCWQNRSVSNIRYLFWLFLIWVQISPKSLPYLSLP